MWNNLKNGHLGSIQCSVCNESNACTQQAINRYRLTVRNGEYLAWKVVKLEIWYLWQAVVIFFSAREITTVLYHNLPLIYYWGGLTIWLIVKCYQLVVFSKPFYTLWTWGSIFRFMPRKMTWEKVAMRKAWKLEMLALAWPVVWLAFLSKEHLSASDVLKD